MYTKDDTESAQVIDRIMAAGIAGLCGYFLGTVLVFILASFISSAHWIKWAIAAAFAIFGFIAPSRSRDLWSQFWNELLGFFLKGR